VVAVADSPAGGEMEIEMEEMAEYGKHGSSVLWRKVMDIQTSEINVSALT
jgi:hypothetical protein